MTYGGPGIPRTLRGQPVDLIAIPAGGSFLIPAGNFATLCGLYTQLQIKSPVSGLWKPYDSIPGAIINVPSDGGNFRFFNPTGCIVDSLLTNAGSGYTSVPTVTVSAGGSTALAIMGQAISSISVVTGGSGYTLPPTVQVSAPPAGGRPAMAYATISGGAVTAITVADAGSGFGGIANVSATANLPTITITPNAAEPNPALIVNATAAPVLSAAGTVTDVVITNNGTPLTAVPTFAFSGGGGTGAAATAIMAFTVTAQTVSGGVGYAGAINYTTVGGYTSGSAVYTKSQALSTSRQAQGVVTASAGALSSAVIYDGGLFQAVPSGVVTQVGIVTTAGTVNTPTVGGATDICGLVAI